MAITGAYDAGVEDTQLRNTDGPSVSTSVEAPTYTVGDSHAVAIGQAGGFDNVAVNGAAVSAIVSQIASVPAGANVILSAGNNNIGDTPASVLTAVNGIISSLHAKNCKVLFVVFPPIDLNGQYSSSYERYSPNYNSVRNTLAVNLTSADHKLALRTEEINPNDPMKIHATSAAYTRIANSAKAAFGGTADTSTPPPDTAVPAATTQTSAAPSAQQTGPSPVTRQMSSQAGLNPYVYQPIDFFDDRYDFKSGQKIKSGGIPGAFGGGAAPSPIPSNVTPPPAQTTPQTVPGAAPVGYGAGQVDPRLAAAAAQSSAPVPGTTGYGTGQIDPRLAAAAANNTSSRQSDTSRTLPRAQ